MANSKLQIVGRWLSVIVLVAALLLFWDSPLLWPLKIFVVLLHELSHILAMVLTGGHPSAISLSMNQGGLAQGTYLTFIQTAVGYIDFV